MSPVAGPSSLRQLAGLVPGLLDPSQRDRLLRFPTSRISFASFNPRTASVAQDASDVRKLSLNEELYNAKRVVVETHPTGESSWRFVPKAQLDEGVVDEGQWPRVVDICGSLYECSQDQWDFYKLDPNYDCRVRAPPALTTVTPAALKPKESPRANGKRAVLTDASMPPLNKRKKTRHSSSETPFTINLDDEEDSEIEEVEEMIVDDDSPPRARSRSRSRSAGVGGGDKARKMREKILENRKARREKVARRAEKLSHENETFFEFGSGDLGAPGFTSVDNAAKRKAPSLTESLQRVPDTDYVRPSEEENVRNSVYYEQTKEGKRTRTASPGTAKRELDAKRQQRDRKRQEKREAKVNGRRQQWYEQFMQEIYAEVPELHENGNGNGIHDDAQLSDSEGSCSPRSNTPDTEFDEDAAREAAIAESRRKLAELEADRPLWDAEARKRALREKAEQEARRLQAEERKWAEARKAEEARQAESRRRANEQREREAAERRQREEAARRQREKQQRQQRWAYGPWTTQRALERYKTLCEGFDVTKFSTEEPLSFEAIPWPVLISPVSLSVEDVDWAAVEKFFETVRPHMRSQDYKAFVEKSHRRFHPDRWRSRGLLKTVVDESERCCLEVAANTVAQALTPLWREITGR